MPVEEVDNITAHVPEDTLFYINESQLEVAEPENVKLLVDSIVPDEDNTLYTKAVDGFEEITSEHNVKFNYLDLVDTGNGNAYVTTAGKPITGRIRRAPTRWMSSILSIMRAWIEMITQVLRTENMIWSCILRRMATWKTQIKGSGSR